MLLISLQNRILQKPELAHKDSESPSIFYSLFSHDENSIYLKTSLLRKYQEKTLGLPDSTWCWIVEGTKEQAQMCQALLPVIAQNGDRKEETQQASTLRSPSPTHSVTWPNLYTVLPNWIKYYFLRDGEEGKRQKLEGVGESDLAEKC